MSKVESIERQIEALSSEGLATFRAWYSSFDVKAWDEQFTEDVEVGKLDTLADRALRAHEAGQSTKL